MANINSPIKGISVGNIPIDSIDLDVGCWEYEKIKERDVQVFRTNLAISNIRELDTDFAEEMMESSSPSTMTVFDEWEKEDRDYGLYYREMVIGPIRITLVSADPKLLEFRIMEANEHNDQGPSILSKVKPNKAISDRKTEEFSTKDLENFR